MQSGHTEVVNPGDPFPRLKWSDLGHFGGIFQPFLQREPDLGDNYFSFCLICKTSIQVPIENPWNFNGNLLRRFLPYY